MVKTVHCRNVPGIQQALSKVHFPASLISPGSSVAHLNATRLGCIQSEARPGSPQEEPAEVAAPGLLVGVRSFCILQEAVRGRGVFHHPATETAGVSRHINWILIYTSINAPRNFIIGKFMHHSGDCRAGPRGSRGMWPLLTSPAVWWGHGKGVGVQEEGGHRLGLHSDRLRTEIWGGARCDSSECQDRGSGTETRQQRITLESCK